MMQQHYSRVTSYIEITMNKLYLCLLMDCMKRRKERRHQYCVLLTDGWWV